MSRQSNFRGPQVVAIAGRDRPQSKDGEEKGMWSTLLDSVASGKRLPEKNLLVLGGSPDMQKDFLETLSVDAPKRPHDRHKKKPVIANDFALGYTYQDVLDADQEDILARLSIYLLSEPSPSFAPLLKPILTPRSIPETLLVLLLDWSEPWAWVRQLRGWIILLRGVTASIDDASKESLEQIMQEWQRRKRGIATYETGTSAASIQTDVTLPLSQGEWDEPLGLPVCVVCHGADKIDNLEIEQGWKEEEFDFVLQLLRTILMKHGASLIYTSNYVPNSLPTLIHSSLGIHSPLKKQTLKHNVIDRDKILVPPNWDSWGKIRVLREGFDVEGTSSGWSVDIRTSPISNDQNDLNPGADNSSEGAVLQTYENTIADPRKSRSSDSSDAAPRIEVTTRSNQEFLAAQVDTIARLQAEDDEAAAAKPSSGTVSQSNKLSDERVNDQIGPVQVNMGGIQVDADVMVKKLRNREKDTASKTPDPPAGTSSEMTAEEQKAENERMRAFFAGLSKRGVSGSPRNTPGKKRDQTPT